MKRISLRSVLALLLSCAAGGAVLAAGDALPSWPSNPEGIVFKWENGKTPAIISDPDGKPIENYFPMPKGLAWLDRNYAMKFQNGSFPMEQGRENILSRLKKTNRMSLEAVITTLFETPGGNCNVADKPIISFAEQGGPAIPTGAASGDFALTQGAGSFRQNGMLSLFLQTAAAGSPPAMSKVDLCYLIPNGGDGRIAGPGKPAHIIVTYEPGLLVCYADGKKVCENRGIQGDFSAWTMQPFVFAGSGPRAIAYADRQRNWEGKLEEICLYDRVLGPDEAAANYRLCKQRLDARKATAQVKVQAKLVAKSAVHTAAQIVPYRNELAMYEYEVEKVLSGDYKAKKIRVAQWVLMDGVNLAQAQAAVGRSYTLLAEPLDDNPQFSSERQSDTLPFDATLTRYVDAGPIDETPADPAAIKAAEDAKRAKQAARKKVPLDMAQVAPNILKLTGGARTKIVWIRGEALMAFDTQEGKERLLVPNSVGGLPCITADGSRVLFTDTSSQTAWVMDWDGQNRRLISRDRNFCVQCCLRDAETGVDWVYLTDSGSAEQPGWGTQPNDVEKWVYRVNVDNPSVREMVYSGGFSPVFFHVSADGKYAGGEFGLWPKQYLASLTEHKWANGRHIAGLSYRGTGCYPQLAPDNSRRLFYYDGQHENVILHEGDGANPRKIQLASLRPEFYSQQINVVFWASDPRFLTISAPIPAGDVHTQADIYLARFNESYTALADIAQVTDSPVFNTDPYAWVEPKGMPALSKAEGPALSKAEGLPAKAPDIKPLPPLEPVHPSAECQRVRAAAAADWVSPTTGMKFKRIAPGAFSAGSKSLQDVSASRPHEITITRPFCLGVFDVTQEEWEKVMGSNPSDFKGPNLPVENVSWLDAQEFLKKLSAMDKATYRLPTEAEWEYACRAGTATEYSWGPAFDGAYAWDMANSDDRTHEVGLRLPNAWGLYDMSGNVFQWTSDSFVRWKTQPLTDPSNPVDLTVKYGVVKAPDPVYRGGAFSSNPEYCCSGARAYVPDGVKYHSRAIGLRAARDAEPATAAK